MNKLYSKKLFGDWYEYSWKINKDEHHSVMEILFNRGLDPNNIMVIPIDRESLLVSFECSERMYVEIEKRTNKILIKT